MTAALAFLVIMTNVASTSGKAMTSMPFPTMAACQREARLFNDRVAGVLGGRIHVSAFCIDARPE